MGSSVRGFARVLLEGSFVVPEAQVHVLDVPWQLFTYQVFHRRAVNRLIHVAGISSSTAATYALADCIAPGAGAVLAFSLAAFHVALARRAALVRIAPVILASHFGLWLVARALMTSVAAGSSSPERVLLGMIAAASLLQAVAHSGEPRVPAPIAGGPRWAALGDWWRGMSVRRAAWFMLLPGYVLAEMVSAPRNLFLIIALGCQRIGVTSEAFRTLVARVDDICASADPPLRRAELHRALAAASGAEPLR